MSERLKFDYYYGKEADMFSFLRIPRLLVKDPHFKILTNDAKMLYGLMLDRMSLSIKNEWQDDEDRTYIIYKIDSIAEDLGCARKKAMSSLAELEKIGLVEKVKLGLGKPDIIYVKNFVCIEIVHDDSKGEEMAGKPCDSTEVLKRDSKESLKGTSRGFQKGLQEVPKKDFKESSNDTSRGPQKELQEVPERHPNYTNNNQTDFNQTEDNHIKSINLEDRGDYAENDGMDEIDAIYDYVKSIIEYDALVCDHPYKQKTIDELVDIMVETMVVDNPTFWINQRNIPRKLVISRFEKYDQQLMEYVLYSLDDNTTKVKKVKNYLLTTLYNAPMTIDNHYHSEVMHDMYGRRD